MTLLFQSKAVFSPLWWSAYRAETQCSHATNEPARDDISCHRTSQTQKFAGRSFWARSNTTYLQLIIILPISPPKQPRRGKVCILSDMSMKASLIISIFILECVAVDCFHISIENTRSLTRRHGSLYAAKDDVSAVEAFGIGECLPVFLAGRNPVAPCFKRGPQLSEPAYTK